MWTCRSVPAYFAGTSNVLFFSLLGVTSQGTRRVLSSQMKNCLNGVDHDGLAVNSMISPGASHEQYHVRIASATGSSSFLPFILSGSLAVLRAFINQLRCLAVASILPMAVPFTRGCSAQVDFLLSLFGEFPRWTRSRAIDSFCTNTAA